MAGVPGAWKSVSWILEAVPRTEAELQQVQGRSRWDGFRLRPVRGSKSVREVSLRDPLCLGREMEERALAAILP